MNLQTIYPQLKAKFYVYGLAPDTLLSAIYASDWLDYLRKYLTAQTVLVRKRPDLERRKMTTEVDVLLSLTRKHRRNMVHFHTLRRTAKLEERKTRKEKRK